MFIPDTWLSPDPHSHRRLGRLVSYARNTAYLFPVSITVRPVVTQPPHHQHHDQRAHKDLPAIAIKEWSLRFLEYHRTRSDRLVLTAPFCWPPLDIISCQLTHQVAYRSPFMQPMSISAKRDLKHDKWARIGGAAQLGVRRCPAVHADGWLCWAPGFDEVGASWNALNLLDDCVVRDTCVPLVGFETMDSDSRCRYRLVSIQWGDRHHHYHAVPLAQRTACSSCLKRRALPRILTTRFRCPSPQKHVSSGPWYLTRDNFTKSFIIPPPSTLRSSDLQPTASVLRPT